MRRNAGMFISIIAILSSAMVILIGPAGAEPSADEIAPPLPVIVPTPSNFTPQFPFPFDQTRGSVTDPDINAQREMCQWYNAQYTTLMAQIDRFNAKLIRDNGDYAVGDNQQAADAVVANIDQTEVFLAPRAQALTQSQDFAGDQYFPLYQGKSFYLLWQLLSNVSAGIHGHQPAWFVGPSFQRAMRWGSEINRSHVCR
ncbi:MAG: hypothetical protein QOI90_542 [Mycobacterium sp.]|jgi:hypothetical protein|nr:hypothetical protein [Mycobacterium sp.]